MNNEIKKSEDDLLQELKNIIVNDMGMDWGKELQYIEFDWDSDIKYLPTYQPAEDQKKWLLKSIMEIEKDAKCQYFNKSDLGGDLDKHEHRANRIIELKADIRICRLKKELDKIAAL